MTYKMIRLFYYATECTDNEEKLSTFHEKIAGFWAQFVELCRKTNDFLRGNER
ncbi:hypothetical protein Bsel_3237 [[Bacillus] selenitireducens MLS10]|uniref:Uncharacterized protein n=1 Tax=Bacillus selenitireducens (strain ATCC 700615 / DSM 15326 / MLS10) TaxID=439292 RepID=D6Y1D2_BACIE|nr:hypothetical protein Bsel_3237 [[Bacillus] selenitireducens MLS10]